MICYQLSYPGLDNFAYLNSNSSQSFGWLILKCFVKDSKSKGNKINGVNVTTSREINVLGVVFDAKLQWGPQVKRALTSKQSRINVTNSDQDNQIMNHNFYIHHT